MTRPRPDISAFILDLFGVVIAFDNESCTAGSHSVAPSPTALSSHGPSTLSSVPRGPDTAASTWTPQRSTGPAGSSSSLTDEGCARRGAANGGPVFSPRRAPVGWIRMVAVLLVGGARHT
jgi:hypothetical protein